MVISCCAVGCANRQKSKPALSFYRFPSDPERKAKWIAAVNRKDWNPTEYSRICSEHFVSGTKSNHPLSQDYVPSIFQHIKSPQKRRSQSNLESFQRRQALKIRRQEEDKRQAAADGLLNLLKLPEETKNLEVHCEFEMQDSMSPISNDVSPGDACTQTDLTMTYLTGLENECQSLRTENICLKEKLDSNNFSEEDSFRDDNEKVLCFTGLANFTVMMSVYNIVKPCLSAKSILSPFQQFLMTCIRIKYNLTVEFLGYIFGVHSSTISRIFNDVVDILDQRLVPLMVIWPEREPLRQSLPVTFRGRFSKCVSIIDCFEVFIEKPSDSNAQKQTYSQYNSHNTIKYLISITPQGVISFISNGWGGRTTDTHITSNCGILNNLLPGDLILADRGFVIEDEVGLYCARVDIPPFKRGQKQFNPVKLEEGGDLASVRIHVERVIGVARQQYTMLEGPVPITLLKNDPDTNRTTYDKIVRIACSMVNMCKSVVSFD